MSHYLIEQIAALDEHRRAHRRARRSRPRARTATCARLRIRDADGDRDGRATSTPCFVFIGAAPRTDWLDGVVARDERGFILAGADAQARGLAAQARPLPAGDERARRLRRRRRPRALDQARRQRGRRGLDGRLAHPPVPGRRMTPRAVTARRPARRRPLRRPRRRRSSPSGPRSRSRSHVAAGDDHRRAGRERRGPAAPARGQRAGRCSSRATASSPSAASTRRRGWARSRSLTERPLGVRMQAETDCALALIAADDFRRLAFAQPRGAPARHAARSRR